MNRNKYAVVKFKSYSSYSEIPTAWLIISDDDNNKYQQCWWPPRTTNSALAIANCANPNPNTWSRFEVEFIKYCSSYETARKSAADSNYETTDEERLGRGKRSHVPHNPYESDEEDDINQQTRKTYCKKKQSKSCILPALPPCPDTFGSVRKSFDMPPNNNKASYKSAQKSAADANYETDKEQLSREKRSHMNRFESDEEENNDQQNQNNYASYKSAQKSAADANNETDEEQLSRGKRSHVNRFESDEEENNNQQTQNNYGKSMYNIERQSNSSVFSAGQSCSNTSGSFDMSRHNNKDSDKENNLRRVQSSKKSCHRNSPDSPTASSREILRQMQRTQCENTLILKDLVQRFTRMEDTLKHPITHSAGYDDRIIAPLLPLSTIGEIKDFDTLLRRTEGAVVQFTDLLKKTGGTNARDSIHRALKKLFSNECAMNCSWKGIRNNFRVSDLYFIKIMKREMISYHASLTESAFDEITAEWLRFAKQRSQRESRDKNAAEKDVDCPKP
ncbi:uncharacterized protein [Temnothorax nylanderi]|uniref:uncharacterized protein isoform X1 n=1 Tax=Temnothorax nylanderi TaxID=102681 RepID=UPI003A87ED9C